MRVSHIRWSARVTKIYTKQRQKKPVRSQLLVSNELWGHEGDIVPRPAHLQPWRAPQSTHISPASVQEITRHIAGTCQPLQHAELRMCTKSTLEMDWAGGEGTAAPASVALSQTEVDHIQGTIRNKEMLLPFRGCYNSPRCALTGSYLKIEGPGVLIIVRTEKELPLVWTKLVDEGTESTPEQDFEAQGDERLDTIQECEPAAQKPKCILSSIKRLIFLTWLQVKCYLEEQTVTASTLIHFVSALDTESCRSFSCHELLCSLKYRLNALHGKKKDILHLMIRRITYLKWKLGFLMKFKNSDIWIF